MKIETPMGMAWASVENGVVTRFGFGDDPHESAADPDVARQVDEYFGGARAAFDLPLAPRGSAFQKRVWSELMRIPFGETISYAELARRVGRPGASRAVGRANATNPIALIIPCHRVIGSTGALTGYAFGVDLKRKLIEWERTVADERRSDIALSGESGLSRAAAR
ncbi:MAG TPA: methylated-DNA--[protein]-cysteine S-methyltransferase [Bryobacteraceae bacterium]|nr:methylated-DNA--[protein]-cysteine S-methyltransferase [Bryobacteraceae bacterium]